MKAPLEYSAVPPKWGRRTRVRTSIAICAAVAIGYAVYEWGPGAYQWVNAMKDQWRFLRYAAPADRVIIEMDESSAKALFSRPEYVRLMLTSHVAALGSGFDPEPPGISLGHEPREVMAFLHERQTPKGERRLVKAHFILGNQCWLETRVFGPGWNGLKLRRDVMKPAYISTSVERVYAGQTDPADPTHFTIRYVEGGIAGTIDAWLQDDDSVKFHRR